MQKHCVLLREGSLSYLRQEDDTPHQHTMIFLILHSWKRHSWGTAAHTECENSNSSTHNLFSSVRDNKSYEYTIAIVQKPCQKPSQVFIPSCSDLNRNNCVLFLLFCKNICRLHNQYSRNYSIEICNNEIYTSKFHLQNPERGFTRETRKMPFGICVWTRRTFLSLAKRFAVSRFPRACTTCRVSWSSVVAPGGALESMQSSSVSSYSPGSCEDLYGCVESSIGPPAALEWFQIHALRTLFKGISRGESCGFREDSNQCSSGSSSDAQVEFSLPQVAVCSNLACRILMMLR